MLVRTPIQLLAGKPVAQSRSRATSDALTRRGVRVLQQTVLSSSDEGFVGNQLATHPNGLQSVQEFLGRNASSPCETLPSTGSKAMLNLLPISSGLASLSSV